MIFTSSNSDCINQMGQRSISGSWFSWTLPDGSTLAYDQNPGPNSRLCEAGRALDFLTSSKLQLLPSGAAYVLSDIVVFRGAVGIPWAFGLDDIFGTARDSNFLWATSCLPVLTANPIRCSAKGEVGFNSSGQMWVSNGSCNITQKLAVRPDMAPAAVKGACTKNHNLGTATILFGATNGALNQTRLSNGDPAGYADILSSAIAGEILDNT